VFSFSVFDITGTSEPSTSSLTHYFCFCFFRAREIGCNNAETPDMFGHYRQAKFTMIKHHWWWKVRGGIVHKVPQ